MIGQVWSLVCLIFFMCEIPVHVLTYKCNAATSVTMATIPEGMDADTFNSMIVDKPLGELYFALPSPPPFEPDINYIATIVKAGPKKYYTLSYGETPTANPTCATGNVSLELFGLGTKARFIRNIDNPDPNTHVLQVMWSSCPERYIWSMRCSQWSGNSNKCPVHAVQLGIYVSQTHLNDLPMDDIVRDICPTGIKFGASDFKWFYSFGANTLC